MCTAGPLSHILTLQSRRMPANVVKLLSGGDRRSLGRANQVGAQAAKQPAIFARLIEALFHDDPVVRMRSADAAEKASRSNPKLLAPHKAELLGLLTSETQIEVKWHLPQMLTRLPLTAAERRDAIDTLQSYLQDRSSIVKTLAMQALADFAIEDPSLRLDALNTIRRLTKTGTAAMRARGRKLLAHLERFEP